MRRIQTWLAQISRRQRTTIYVLLAFSTGLSAWMVASFAGERSGYAASYATAAAFFFSCIFALAGFVLIPWRKTRWLGLTSLASAVWLAGSYLGTANILYRLNLVRWKGEHEVSILPEPGTAYYIYFQQGTSDAQIENFSDRVLH